MRLMQVQSNYSTQTHEERLDGTIAELENIASLQPLNNSRRKRKQTGVAKTKHAICFLLNALMATGVPSQGNTVLLYCIACYILHCNLLYCNVLHCIVSYRIVLRETCPTLTRILVENNDSQKTHNETF